MIFCNIHTCIYPLVQKYGSTFLMNISFNLQFTPCKFYPDSEILKWQVLWNSPFLVYCLRKVRQATVVIMQCFIQIICMTLKLKNPNRRKSIWKYWIICFRSTSDGDCVCCCLYRPKAYDKGNGLKQSLYSIDSWDIHFLQPYVYDDQ